MVPMHSGSRCGGALIAIFFIALILGGIEYVRRENRLVRFAHEQLTLQRDVTEAVLAQARQDLIPPGTLLRSSGTGSSSSYMNWGSQTAFMESSGRGLIRLEIKAAERERTPADQYHRGRRRAESRDHPQADQGVRQEEVECEQRLR